MTHSKRPTTPSKHFQSTFKNNIVISKHTKYSGIPIKVFRNSHQSIQEFPSKYSGIPIKVLRNSHQSI
jgi:hypothetical protein